MSRKKINIKRHFFNGRWRGTLMTFTLYNNEIDITFWRRLCYQWGPEWSNQPLNNSSIPIIQYRGLFNVPFEVICKGNKDSVHVFLSELRQSLMHSDHFSCLGKYVNRKTFGAFESPFVPYERTQFVNFSNTDTNRYTSFGRRLFPSFRQIITTVGGSLEIGYIIMSLIGEIS